MVVKVLTPDAIYCSSPFGNPTEEPKPSGLAGGGQQLRSWISVCESAVRSLRKIARQSSGGRPGPRKESL